MPERRVESPAYRDENSSIKFPFVDTATLVNGEGLFIPANVLLDAVLYPIGAQARVYLSQIEITNETATLSIGDATTPLLASGTFALFEPPDEFALQDSYGRPAGLIVSSSDGLANFQAWPPGTHTFTVEQTEFAARCCIPMPEICVRGFQLPDGSVLTNDVWLVGGAGVALTPRQVRVGQADGLSDGELQTVIRVDVVGDPLFRRQLCNNTFVTPNFLKQLVVQQGNTQFACGPDAYGNFNITVGQDAAVDTVLRVRALQDGLHFEAVGAGG